MEESTDNVSVKSVSMKWGVISALVGIIFFLILDFIGQSNSNARWLGVVFTIALTYMAHKEFKDEGDGFMSFGQGLGIGTLMALIGSVISSIFVYIYVSFINSNYIEAAKEKAIMDMQEQGQSEGQIDQAMSFMEWMFSPMAMAIMGVLGGVFFGFIVSLIVTIFTKKSNPELV